jgi:O-antigen biosynthesis protein WbqP
MGLMVPAGLLCLAASAGIRITSPGPALFRQKRVGKDERIFTLFKLRTMYIDTRDQPSHHSTASQITPLGAWLRRTKLDELPQILNVLRGEMSFVGPRPGLPSHVELLEARRACGVFSVAPGITGVAQLRGIDMSDPDKLALADGEYIARRSLRLDLIILWRTFAGRGAGDAIGRSLPPAAAKSFGGTPPR